MPDHRSRSDDDDADQIAHDASPALLPEEQQILTIARLIALAMLVGAAIFLLLVLTMGSANDPSPIAAAGDRPTPPAVAVENASQQAPTQDSPGMVVGPPAPGGTTIAPPSAGPRPRTPLSTVVILQLAWSAAVLIALLGYPVYRQPLIAHLIARPKADLDPTLDRIRIARGYLSVCMLTGGMAAGLSLLGTVTFAISERLFDMLFAAGPLLMFMFLMPTSTRLVRFRQSIIERRKLSLGP